MGVDIATLMLKKDDLQPDEYKSGWNDAVCYITETCNITSRGEEPIQIGINLDTEKILKAIKELNDK